VVVVHGSIFAWSARHEMRWGDPAMELPPGVLDKRRLYQGNAAGLSGGYAEGYIPGNGPEYDFPTTSRYSRANASYAALAAAWRPAVVSSRTFSRRASSLRAQRAASSRQS